MELPAGLALVFPLAADWGIFTSVKTSLAANNLTIKSRFCCAPFAEGGGGVGVGAGATVLPAGSEGTDGLSHTTMVVPTKW